MKYQLLITDVDGTLITETREIPTRNLEAIERFRKAGGRVAVATGRITESARPYVHQTGAVGPAILYNGGMIYDYATGEVLFEARLDADSVQEALRVLNGPFRHIDLVVYTGGRRYTRAYTPVIEEFCHRDGIAVDVLPGGVLPEGEVSKLLMIVDPDEMPRLDAALKERRPDANTVRSDRNYLELLPRGASKGAALPALAQLLGVPLERTVAVGDNMNDLTMLQAAGLGVAVANAHPGLKAIADEIVGHCEQGAVADVIERFCLSA